MQDAILFTLWGSQAVPLFLIIQVFHAYKKGLDSAHTSIQKLWKRIIKPFLITSSIIYLLHIIWGIAANDGIKERSFEFLKLGGEGPGSYYVWIYLQFAFLLPLMSPVMKKFGMMGNFVLILVIAEFFELICSLMGVSDWIYRLLFFRYFFLIYIGYYLIYNEIKLSLGLGFITFFSGSFLLILQYSNICFEPFLFDSGWKTQHWLTYGYDLFIIYVIIFVYRKSVNNRITSLLKLMGKYSYEIFLWQMLFFYLPIQNVLIKVLGVPVSTITYIILSLLVCILPVIYIKDKKELILLWNSRK